MLLPGSRLTAPLSQFQTAFGQKFDRGRQSVLKVDVTATEPDGCQSTLVIDTNLKRVVRHVEPVRADRPELSNATRILADEAARREALFQQSVASEKTRGDALSKRFEEALKQARQEPITKPTRDFDLD